MSATTNATDSSGAVIANCFQIGDDPRAAPTAAPAPASPPPAATQVAPPIQPHVQAAPPAKVEPPSAVKTVDLKQVLRQLKDRLRTVEREIKARKTLEQERDQIRRLIAATNNERDNLRRLRSAG